jgi:subtilisin family serine protease
VAGPDDIVADLSEKVQGGTVALTELDRLDFAELGERMAACARLPEKLVIVKYRIEGEQADVLDAIELINDVLGKPSRLLIKEPNWITGQPWEIEGSPWEIEGSPWEIEGSPDESGEITFRALDVPPALFMEQWAFRIIGLLEARHKNGYSGTNVAVGIFDSSPYGLNAPQSNLYFERSANLLAGPSPMKLNLCHVASSGGAVSKCPDGDDVESLKKSAVRNHGYFVAGLINAIAPESQLHLYRVLDNCNRGDLFLLLKGIFMFLRDVVIKEDESRMGAVINMSLVVRLPPSEAAFGLTTDLLSLNYILEAADCLGVVAVSAAGNSSAGAILPRPASLPAGMSGVLSVAASNIDCLRACFSNCGHVAAPGGDGRSADGSPDGECKPRIADCPPGLDCTVRRYRASDKAPIQ